VKLVTYSTDGAPRLGALTDDGRVVDLSRGYFALTAAQGEPVSERRAEVVVPPETVAFLEAGEAAMAAAREVLAFAAEHPEAKGPWDSAIVHDERNVRLRAPILRPPKIVGIGLNYRDHAEEQGARIPSVPLIFAKFATAIVGPGDPIPYPRITQQLDYEAELAFVIGKGGKDIPRERALEHVAGYCAFNDVTARDVQLADRQWVRGKTVDGSAPIGPWLVTRDELPDPGDLAIRLRLNGELMQDSRTSQLIWDVPFLVSFLSEAFTLEPGDVVATGTPSGVGFARKPPVFMHPGDVVRVEIDGLGVLENRIVATE
jgi:acylpyruvate hydrolase